MKASIRLDLDPARLLATFRQRLAAPLRKGAADVRRVARQLIRPGGTSTPGSPPRSHTDLLRKLIVYAYDPDRLTATVGPLASVRNYRDGDRRPVGATVPNVLEFGGRINVREMLLRKGWVRETPSRAARYASAPRRLRTIDVEARPYMRPALETAVPRILEHFRNCLDQ